MNSTAPKLPNLKILRPEDRSMITDIVFTEPSDVLDGEVTDLSQAFAHIGQNTPYWLADPTLSVPGSRDQMLWLMDFYAELRKHHKNDSSFRFSHGAATFRARRLIKANGARRLTLRSIPQSVPDLLDLSLPTYVPDLLLARPLKRSGGLVLIVAPVGQGKSTTLAATLKTRLERFGGQTLTIEEPVEHYLDGFHVGENEVGECIQTSIDPDDPEAYARAVRRSLGEFSVFPGGGATLFISEIRDGATAAEALRAAQAGYLVFATLHAQNIPNTIFRMISLAADLVGQKAAHDMVASALRLVVYQTLTLIPKPIGWRRGSLSAEVLFSPNASSEVANAIRKPDQSIEAILQPLDNQKNILKQSATNGLPFAEVYERLGGTPDDLS